MGAHPRSRKLDTQEADYIRKLNNMYNKIKIFNRRTKKKIKKKKKIRRVSL